MEMKQFNKRRKIKINKVNRSEFNFKEIALTKMAKRQLLVTLLSILGVTIISLGSAYAVFTSVSKSKDYNVIKVGTLNIDFGTDSSNTINLSGQYPMSDEEGLKLTPYTFTIKNTGTLTADYEVFIQDDQDMITQDNCSGNQLNKDYIRYKLDTRAPANLSLIAGSNYKIATGSLEPNGSVTYTLYVWIREGVGNDVLSKHYHGKIVVNGVNTQGDPVNEVVLDNLGDKGDIYDDGVDTFITGEDPNNYIWYSGKLWRAVSVNNEDKTTKLVTQWTISAISYDDSSNYFAGSYMEEWLNDTTVDGFLGNLREPEKFIVMDAKWDATADSRELGSIERPNGTNVVTNTVGLLNAYEYQTSYTGTTYSNGYLNNGLNWWNLTPTTSGNVSIIASDGFKRTSQAFYLAGIRPSINLKSSIRIVSGDGTINNPYRLNGDNDTDLNGTKLNTRYSGEYVKFGNDENNLYRIVSHETSDLTKIASAEPLRKSGSFVHTVFGAANYSSENVVGRFLNGEYLTSYLDSEYSNMIEDKTTWYIGTVLDGQSYKLAKYVDTTMSGYATSVEEKVGLLRMGELMTGQFDVFANNDNYHYITPNSSILIWNVSTSSTVGYNQGASSPMGIKPALNLKSTVIITSGTGTKDNPFEIALGS